MKRNLEKVLKRKSGFHGYKPVISAIAVTTCSPHDIKRYKFEEILFMKDFYNRFNLIIKKKNLPCSEFLLVRRL